MTKDRRRRIPLAEDVAIVFDRSSTHPIEYAITLVVRRNERWHTVRSFDNAHAVEGHHEHRYRGADKQEPVVTQGPVNEAMACGLEPLRLGWPDIVRSWEQTR